MELYELTHTIPANTAPEEVINRIAMDDAATDREKFLVQHVEEALGAAAEKADEVFDRDIEIEDLTAKIRERDEQIATLEREKKEFEVRVPDSTPIASNASLAEVLRAIVIDPKATAREKFLVKYFESRGGTWGWHVNEGRWK